MTTSNSFAWERAYTAGRFARRLDVNIAASMFYLDPSVDSEVLVQGWLDEDRIIKEGAGLRD